MKSGLLVVCCCSYTGRQEPREFLAWRLTDGVLKESAKSLSPSPSGIHPCLVPVVLIGVVQQLVIGWFGSLFPPSAGGAAG